MKRLDLREPGKAEKLKHNQAREMDLVGENEALEELEKRWLMAGNERDWLYDGVKILFPLAPPRQPLLTLNPPPPLADPDTSVWSFIFVFFFPNTPFRRRMCDYFRLLLSKSNAVHPRAADGSVQRCTAVSFPLCWSQCFSHYAPQTKDEPEKIVWIPSEEMSFEKKLKF